MVKQKASWKQANTEEAKPTNKLLMSLGGIQPVEK